MAPGPPSTDPPVEPEDDDDALPDGDDDALPDGDDDALPDGDDGAWLEDDDDALPDGDDGAWPEDDDDALPDGDDEGGPEDDEVPSPGAIMRTAGPEAGGVAGLCSVSPGAGFACASPGGCVGVSIGVPDAAAARAVVPDCAALDAAAAAETADPALARA